MRSFEWRGDRGFATRGMIVHTFGLVLKRIPVCSKVSWKQSFAVRFAVVWAVVLGSAVGLSGWLSYRDARHQLIGSLDGTVVQDARVVELRLTTWLETLGEDTRSASRSPVVAEFIEVQGTGEESRWRGLVEDGFRAVFAGKPTYIQMRLLEVGGPGEGREILRLDRQGEELVVTPREQLQQKGDRDYFREALAIAEGEVYLSEVNLNRDFGKITEPRLPTIRSAIRMRDGEGRELMLIINADLRLLFGELRKLTSPEVEVFLADGKEDFLMHPDESAVFASDLGHGVRFDAGVEEVGISKTRKVVAGHGPGRVFWVRVALADERWQPVLAQSRARGMWTTVLACLAGAGLALIIASFFGRRLGQLTKALRRFDGKEGGEVVEATEGRRDEIGVAIEWFAEMAAKVREHVEDLHRARDDAEEATAAKEHFLAVMSHEIRTPMNAVVGLVRALEANDPSPRQEPILASLQSSTTHLMTLLNTALDYTRLHEGAVRYDQEDFEAAGLAREVVGTLKPLAMAGNLRLEVSAPAKLWVTGDAVRLRQVLNNLLNNALKFTEEGFVRVSIWHDGKGLFGEVADSGPGIPEQEQKRIFTPFYSRAGGDAAGALGAGLGLSVSREMIEQQGGSLTLESSEAGGAVFRFHLPCPKSSEGSPKCDLQRDQVQKLPPGGRLLYVEDTLSNQEVMELTLEGTGLELRCVETGEEALEICRMGEYDLAMVDLQLPDVSGIELAGRLRERLPGLPVVLVTAQASAKNEEIPEGSRICEVILKPYTKDLVLSVLSRHLAVDFSKALKAVHPDDPGKGARLAKAIARDFREAAVALREAAPAEVGQLGSQIRHRFTTILASFPLGRVERALEKIRQAEVVDGRMQGEVVAVLESAAAEIEGSCESDPTPISV